MSLSTSLISEFISHNEHLVWKTIIAFKNRLDLEHEFLFEIIDQQLEKRLSLKFSFEDDHALSYNETLLIQAVQQICNNVEDIILLERKSNELILKYIPHILSKVQYAVTVQKVKEYDAEDVIQIIQQHLLEKLQKGKFDSYDKSSGTLFSTFLMTVISNQIKDISHSLYQTKKSQILQPKIDSTTLKIANEPDSLTRLIQREDQHHIVQQFKILLLTFNNKIKDKLEICLKINTRLMLSIQDAAILRLNIHQSRSLLKIFGSNYSELTLGELWKSICPYINIYEQKETSPDNQRKWYVRVRNQFIVKLLLVSLLKDIKDLDTHPIVKKINSERQISKLAEEWLHSVVEIYYKKKNEKFPN